jgi:hypothetical protein
MPTLRVNDLAPRVQYVADGVQTGFTAPFFFFEPADLQVRFDDGAEAAAHTVDGAGDPGGGAVLFAEPPPAGTRITIWREMALERGTEFQEAGAFRAATINDELDRLTMLAQEQAARLDRVPAFAPTTSAPPMALPAPAAGKYLRWTADGLGLESVLPLETSPIAVTAFAETLLDDPDAAAARSTLGLPAAVQNGTYSYAAAGGAANAIALSVAPAVAAYAAGQMFWFKAAATNTGPVTLAVSGLAAKAVQSNGMALAAGCIRAGDACVVVYDGTQFQLVSARPGGWQLIESISGAAASFDFIKGISPAHDLYKVVVIDMRPTVDTDDLWIRLRDGTFQSDAADYEYAGIVCGSDSDGTSSLRSVADTKIRGTINTGSASTKGVCGVIWLQNPAVASSRNHVRAQLNWGTSANIYRMSDVHGVYKGTQNSIDGIQLRFAAGGTSIASGRADLYAFTR